MKPTLTRQMANAAGMDAGNRSMRSGNRTKWNRKDFVAACVERERLWDIIEAAEAK